MISGSFVLTDTLGKPIGKAESGTGVGIDASTGTSLSPLTLAAGEWPRGNEQIAIDKSTAETEHFKVGDRIGAFADGPVRKYEISGIVRFGEIDSLAGATIAVFDMPTAATLFDKQG